jgi:hypothetical protein
LPSLRPALCTVAEQHVNGKAAHAGYENSKQGWVYDVEVVSGVKVFDVKLDATKGTVISSAEDMALKPRTADDWHVLDKAIGRASGALRADAPKQADCKAALGDLLKTFNTMQGKA